MRKFVWPLMALALAVSAGATTQALSVDYTQTAYSNDFYASRVAYESFNLSIKKRMEAVRLGSSVQGFASAPILRSEDAYAMAPSSRYSTVAGTSRRQLDCVYYNGFTVWGDLYQTWSRQSSNDARTGYRYRGTAPAVGLDWSTGNLTVGVATTYVWGKLKARDFYHDQKVRTWGLTGYAQWNTERFYGSLVLGYGYNRFKSNRSDPGSIPQGGAHNAKYHSNTFGIDAEFGMKFNFGGFQVTPHAGLRYLHDRRGVISESGGSIFYNVQAGRNNYQVLDLPIGATVGYAFNIGGALVVPQFRFEWIPEIARRRGNTSGNYTAWNAGLPASVNFSTDSPRRGRNTFRLGTGVEAKITKSISAHIDYDVYIRSKSYEHHLNLGLGFTF